MEGVDVATRVFKIKCKCRPTPQGTPRPVSNLLWLKRGAHDNRGLGGTFTMAVRNAVVTETGQPNEPVGEHVLTLECTKCHRVHAVKFAQLAQWWGDFLNGGTPSIEL